MTEWRTMLRHKLNMYKMARKKSNICSLFLPFRIGIVLGITAILIDVPYVTSKFPVFDNIMGRFGIWVWAAAIISILSKTALFAAVRSFLFFVGMLLAYYGYTVLFLKFFPKSQIILWSGIAMITPFCGFLYRMVFNRFYWFWHCKR